MVFFLVLDVLEGINKGSWNLVLISCVILKSVLSDSGMF